MNIPSDLKYTKTHEWVRMDGDKAVIGISEYAQKEISDVVFVELPEAGRTVSANEGACVVESVKAAFDIYSPLSGEIVTVNTELESNAAMVNTDPYNAGWFFTMAPSNLNEMEELLDAQAYEQFIHSVSH